jgi:hypothetical protein
MVRPCIEVREILEYMLLFITVKIVSYYRLLWTVTYFTLAISTLSAMYVLLTYITLHVIVYNIVYIAYIASNIASNIAYFFFFKLSH